MWVFYQIEIKKIYKYLLWWLILILNLIRSRITFKDFWACLYKIIFIRFIEEGKPSHCGENIHDYIYTGEIMSENIHHCFLCYDICNKNNDLKCLLPELFLHDSLKVKIKVSSLSCFCPGILSHQKENYLVYQDKKETLLLERT